MRSPFSPPALSASLTTEILIFSLSLFLSFVFILFIRFFIYSRGAIFNEEQCINLGSCNAESRSQYRENDAFGLKERRNCSPVEVELEFLHFNWFEL